MQQAFLIIIAVLGAIYAFISRKAQIGLGLLLVGVSFVFSIPSIVTSNFWTQVFEALTMVIFAVGVFIVVYKKKPKEGEKAPEKIDNEEIKQS